MAEPARKLEPEQGKGPYLHRIGEDIKESQVDTTPDLEYLDSEDGEETEGGEYAPPPLELIGDEEEEGEEQPQINGEDFERNAEPTRPSQAQTPQEQLAKDQVPEYVAPTGVEEPQPGGPAIEPKPKQGEPREQAKEQAKEQAQGAVKKEVQTGAKQAGKAVADATSQAAKKAAEAVAKWAAQLGAKVVAATSEFWLPILLGIIALIILIVGIVFLVRALQTPNRDGSSPVQAADILNDRSWISKVLGLSGDKNVADKLTSEVLSGLSQDLARLESDMNSPAHSSSPTKAQVLAKIQEVRGYITTFQQLPPNDKQKNELGVKIVIAVGQLSDLFGQAPWHFPGQTAWPIPKDKIRSFNNTLHCGTPLRPEDCGKHRTLEQFMDGTADATDINAPYNTEVFAAFDGTVVKTGNVLGTYIEIKSTDGHYLAVYMHMRAVKVNEGNRVKAGDSIGQLTGLQNGITSPHLHFELYKDGQAIVTTKEDIASRQYKRVGQYLWERDKAALNLN